MIFKKAHIEVGKKNFQSRDKWLNDTLKKIPNGSKLLDAGAGQLANKIHCAHLDYVSQDLCEYDGKGDNKGMHPGEWDISKIDIVSDIVNMPVDDNVFDVVLCTEVLEHLPDPVKAINELVRVTKSGGTLILTAPFCSLTHFAPYHFSTGFNRYFYQHHLAEAGCEVLEISENGNFFEYIAQEIHRLPNVANEYTGGKLSFIERFAHKIVLKALYRFSKLDSSSQQLLCYGYHVVSLKK